MYIEFRLPNGAGGMAAGYTKHAILKELKALVDAHHLTIVEQVQQPYRLRVELATPEQLTMLILAWKPKNEFFKFTVWDEPITTQMDKLRYQKR